MYVSHVTPLGPVKFPAFLGERHYMRKFTKKEGLPADLRHWQETVDAMLETVDTDNPIFLMVDQKIVPAGGLHRRPGPHIDGYWDEGIHGHGAHIGAHGGTYPGHGSSPSSPPAGSHRYTPPQRHGATPPKPQGHRSEPISVPSHRGYSRHSAGGAWSEATLKEPEALILASNVSACRGWVGPYSGTLGEGGDCSGINFDTLEAFDLEAHRVYAGNVAFIHESLPVQYDVARTLVRLNVQGWEPTFH